MTAGLAPGLRTRAFVFNTLLADKSTDDRLRSYPSWVGSRNLANEASDESVQALVDAVVSRYDIPQRWYSLKARLLDLIRNFIIFDGGRKKVPRPHQYFAVKAAQEKLDSEIRLFQTGESTNFLVLTRQNELLESRRRAVVARLEYNKAAARLEQARGETLESHKISVR